MVLKTWLLTAGSLAFAAHSIPGLGDVIVSATDDRLRMALSGPGFQVTRAIGSGGDVEITVGGGGELIALIVRFGGRQALTVRRGANVQAGVSNLSAVRQLTEGRAVASLREHVGEFERRLLAQPTAAGGDDPHAHGFLAGTALVSALAGDPSAIGRVRDIVTARASARASFANGGHTCLSAYDAAALRSDRARSACLAVANADESWHHRTGQRLICDADYVASIGAAEAAFVSCPRRAPGEGGIRDRFRAGVMRHHIGASGIVRRSRGRIAFGPR